MDGVILYQSKYGAAKKYADWLAEETGYPCMETKKADIKAIPHIKRCQIPPSVI